MGPSRADEHITPTSQVAFGDRLHLSRDYRKSCVFVQTASSSGLHGAVFDFCCRDALPKSRRHDTRSLLRSAEDDFAEVINFRDGRIKRSMPAWVHHSTGVEMGRFFRVSEVFFIR